MQEKLKALVVAAVRLAIIRHGLSSDYDEDPMTDEDAAAIGEDVWNALNGIETCAGLMSDELQALANVRES